MLSRICTDVVQEMSRLFCRKQYTLVIVYWFEVDQTLSRICTDVVQDLHRHCPDVVQMS